MSFHDKVVYQIYPKSFKDTTGNGVGDLRGIIEKADYIASLGVDMVWLNPFFPSPGNDNGYDVSDYCAIDPAMGTMDDFDEMVAALAQRGVGVMLDMVLNHTSTEHEWFQRALAGDPHYQDYYILRPAKEDGSAPTNWVSKFGGPAWAPFGQTGLYYLHLFDTTQADLNWRNPAVRAEAARVVNFWRARGVRGFRFDVINLIGKDEVLRDAPAGTDDRAMYTDGPLVHDYLRELAAASFGQDPEAVTVGEMSSTSVEACVGYSNPDNRELDMVFSFHHLKVDYAGGAKWTRMPYDLAALKRIIDQWATGMQDGGGWNALFWNNHDQPRAIDRFADPHHYHARSATMLATAIHLLRGTPYIYMGEEIGMTDPDYLTIEDYVDVEARNAYDELIAGGMEPGEAFATVHAKARDNARTPMQWDSSPGAGFTQGTPWLRPTNQERINVADQEREGVILPYYRRLVALRKQYPVIAHGRYEPWAAEHPDVLAYTRELDGTRLLVLCNFRGHETSVEVPRDLAGAQVLLTNAEDRERLDRAPAAGSLTLGPYEALALIS
ncbi:alpha,alpha-phosphotrehalase [Actinomyces bowdenii]|uniref:Alpha,alpha-phosphotrehalase n=1 Tax=Actinomyces bowdenii TaxID=131109 RepID=A0A853EJE7_9ACTO|nr:alpha,alpha-phosphotrehalase [Actinomyces bowdenii]MBF0696507.1 alpha,alpha-phosphotrehalase [Actinomyces bowdenii]NYS68680.1 alpha,alpha-phosphotrehalase [Actinomyces bowdenii]